MDFMLAKPLDSLGDLDDPTAWTVEDKYDGIRSQVHSDSHRVVIFTRGLEETTAAFPEICEAAKALKGRVALDGEILAWKDGKALPFNVLQQRLARKKVVASHLDDIPVVFLAYDILFYEGRMLVDRPIEERRSILRELIAAAGSPLLQASLVTTAESSEQIDRAYHEARERGNEGLILKRNGSAYEAGKRSGTWLKVKRPYATLDVVVTAAETGTGRRAVFLSDYTFAVRSGEGFVNVGKAYSGLTDVEVRELTRIFRASAINRFGRVTLVKPEVVFEVAFDGVQKSPRHKSGYALRFPRILRWRKDKSAAEADDLDRVRELYEASLVSLAIHERRDEGGS
jgi:DNA ligase 1